VIKPKSTTSFHTTFVNFMYNGEVSRLDNLFDLAVELKIINKQGGSYSCSEVFLGRGRGAAVSSLHEHPQLAKELEAIIRRQFLPSSAIPVDEGCK
jgi:recombination protein RecA